MNKATLIKNLRAEEGVRNKRYKDTKGIWTIGVGWSIDANPLPEHIASYEKEHGVITDAMVDELLSISIERTLELCLKLWPNFNSFPENPQLALADVMFNMGIGTLKKFKRMNLALSLDPPSFRNARNELLFADGCLLPSRWSTQVGATRTAAIAHLLSS